MIVRVERKKNNKKDVELTDQDKSILNCFSNEISPFENKTNVNFDIFPTLQYLSVNGKRIMYTIIK